MFLSYSAVGKRIPAPPPVLLSSASRQSLGDELVATTPAAATSAVWPTVRKIIYVPFFLERADTVRKMWWWNGAAVSGNVLAGVYSAVAGLPSKLIVGSASTAQANINVLQEADITDTLLTAGQYFMALALDNVTGAITRYGISAGNGIGHACVTLGLASETPGAFALPATATPVVVGTSVYPVFGLAFRTLVA